MRKLIVITVILAGTLLSGCDLLDIITGGGDTGGGGTGGGGIGGVNFVRMIVEYDFSADVLRNDTGVELHGIFASIGSIGNLAFDQATNSYVAQTPLGSDPYVHITITLDSAGSMITYLNAFRRMSHGVGASWERIDQIIAYDIPYDRVEGYNTFYRIDADDLMWAGLERVEYKDWFKPEYTEQDPMYRMVDPTAAQTFFDNDPNRYIEIEFQQ